MYRDPDLYPRMVLFFVGACVLTGVVLAASTGLLQGWRSESQARGEPGRRSARSLPLSRPTQTPTGEFLPDRYHPDVVLPRRRSGRSQASTPGRVTPPAPVRGGAPRALISLPAT